MQNQKEMVRGIGFLALVASCFNCTVGGGIFRLPNSIFEIAGRASPLIYVVCFLVMLLVAGVFIQVGRTIRVSGGPYAYVKPVLGEYFGFICGVLLWTLATFAFASVSNAYAHFVALFFPAQMNPVFEASILGVSLIGLSIFNSQGVKSGARVSLALALFKVLPLLFLLLIGLPHLDASAMALPEHFDTGAMARAAMILIFAFTGVESALIPSGEIENPEKTLPRALVFSSVMVLVLYVGVHSVSQSVLGAGLAEKGISPLALAAEKLVGPIGKTILGLGAVVSTLGYLSAMTLSLPRSLFAFAEDGYLPKFLAKLSPSTHAPTRAIWVQVGIVYLLAVSAQFERLAVISNLAAILMYVLCAIAAIILIKRQGKITLISIAIPVGAILTMGFLLTSVSSLEWAGVLGLVALASVFFWIKRFLMK